MPQKLDVAYFTMEIGLSSEIPTFAGGLGVLAADMMRGAADIGTNVACVTGCWRYGYLHQNLRPDGTQNYEEISWDPSKKLKKLPQTVTVKVEGRDVTVGCWQLDLQGAKRSVPIYFLDTNIPENNPEDRDITKNLYGGDVGMRIKQEIVLGIGGVRMLRALGYDRINNFHLNEGHCSFLTLELLRERGFKDEDVRPSCAFTTHTPIKAGHDIFPYDLAWRIAGDQLPWHIKKLAGEDTLSMTQLAMTLSHDTFGVSRVHGMVSQRLLNNPRVGYITNGVHHLEWTSPEMRGLFDRYVPGWRGHPHLLHEHCRELPDDELWGAHQAAKKRLIDAVNAQGKVHFDPDRLTIVTARRIVPYKRPELLYTNLQRLREVAQGKLQIIHAGNAHPHDAFSQGVIRHIIERSGELKDAVNIAYLPNYNPDLAKLLVSGADVWLNTPTRLQEASGTSGMKACLNGVLNLSTLDGWWVEGYEMDPEAGWRIGPLAEALPTDEDTRKTDAEDLYTQLQYEVIPEYGYPKRERWIRRMKRAVGLMGTFNAQRCVEEYQAKAWTNA
ncbi:MAG: alpha-glucan family phosphorylase [Candidatus Peribacteraceae bacterium]|nr:alpha-glucan family phosphorylase [Candidatus Peribacteraceae bacterium]